jgi:glycosyltransferase involved in cell wall biosynthesis
MQGGRIEVPENVRVYSVGKEKGYSEPRRAIEFYRHLFRILREDRIDVCFSHMIPIFTVMGAPVLKAKGIPIVTWYAHRQITTILRVAHHLSNRMVSVNESSYPYHHDKFVSLGHGIDTELFSPVGTVLDNQPLFVSVGRLSPIKDSVTFVRAVYLLHQKGYDVQAALVGDTPERDRLYAEQVRNEVERLGLSEVVKFLGPLLQVQVVTWYRRCLAHVNCSPLDHSLDKAPLETMACGKPSFSSTAGFRETMGRWAERFLFRHNDPEDLAARLEWLLQLNDAERQAIGTDLRHRVVGRHSLEQLGNSLVDLLAKVCRK